MNIPIKDINLKQLILIAQEMADKVIPNIFMTLLVLVKFKVKVNVI